MSTGPKHNWGGKREGSGRKAHSGDEKIRKNIIKRVKKWEREFKVPFYDVLFALCYGKTIDGQELEVDRKTQVAAAKVILDNLSTRKTEQNIRIEGAERPGIWLPERRPDPAKKIERIAEA